MRIGINGFGRIGRNFTKALLERHPDVEIAAVNDLTSAAECAHLFKYDSNYGTYRRQRDASRTTAIAIDGRTIKVLAERDPGKLPWKDLGVDVVVESTGLFTDAAKARAHIDGGGAKKVIISAPAKGEDITIVLGVNDKNYDPAKHHIISNASCTTNCLGAGGQSRSSTNWAGSKAFMSTIHSYTNDQNILDAPHKRSAPRAQRRDQHHPDLDRRGQSAVPDDSRSEGHASTASRCACRRRPSRWSISSRSTKKATTKDELNALLKKAADGPLKHVLQYTEEELVSSDFKRNPYSSIVDGKLTNAQGDLIQLGPGTTTSGATRAVSPTSRRWSSQKMPASGLT